MYNPENIFIESYDLLLEVLSALNHKNRTQISLAVHNFLNEHNTKYLYYKMYATKVKCYYCRKEIDNYNKDKSGAWFCSYDCYDKYAKSNEIKVKAEERISLGIHNKEY